MVAAGQRNPQHFHYVCTGSAPLCTSDPHVCAQTAGKQSCCLAGWQAVADRRAGACVPGQPADARIWPRVDEIAPGTQPPDDRRRPDDRPPAPSPPPVGPARILIDRGLRVLDTLKLPRLRRWSRPACAAQPQAEHDTLVPSPAGFGS